MGRATPPHIKNITHEKEESKMNIAVVAGVFVAALVAVLMRRRHREEK